MVTAARTAKDSGGADGADRADRTKGEHGSDGGGRAGAGGEGVAGAPGAPEVAGGDAAAGAPLPRPLLRAALALYLDLHAHPELSGHEHRTADLLAAWLTEHSCTVTRAVGGGHGLVGVLRNGPGPTVLLRTELDALPVTEATGLPYASTTPGVMHACGHDLHIAAAAGAVALLAADRDSWRGTVLVVGQPAEETLSGARSMLEDGRLYERFGTPDAALAQHAAPLPAGTVAHAPGGAPLMAGSIAADVTLYGRGGHAATPHLTVDPVLMAAATVLGLQSVVARRPPPPNRPCSPWARCGRASAATSPRTPPNSPSPQGRSPTPRSTACWPPRHVSYGPRPPPRAPRANRSSR